MVDQLARELPAEAYLESRGVVIPPEPAVITPVIRRAILDGDYAAEIAVRIAEVVRPDDKVVEIGAGIGVVSTLLARERRVTSVLAVEANPELAGYMERLHARNHVRKLRRLNAAATGDATACASFYLRRDFRASSTAAGPEPYEKRIEVPARSLDALLGDEGATLLVCDACGAETALFEAADLGGLDRVFLRLHEGLIGPGGVAGVFATLAGHGFVYDPCHSAGSAVLFRRHVAPRKIWRIGD